MFLLISYNIFINWHQLFYWISRVALLISKLSAYLRDIVGV